MEDHLSQTEGLMRPIGCSLGLTEGSLNSKKRLLVASENGPLSPRQYPRVPRVPPWIRLCLELQVHPRLLWTELGPVHMRQNA